MKIVQITTMPGNFFYKPRIFAVGDDGLIYMFTDKEQWQKLPPLPNNQ